MLHQLQHSKFSGAHDGTRERTRRVFMLLSSIQLNNSPRPLARSVMRNERPAAAVRPRKDTNFTSSCIRAAIDRLNNCAAGVLSGGRVCRCPDHSTFHWRAAAAAVFNRPRPVRPAVAVHGFAYRPASSAIHASSLYRCGERPHTSRAHPIAMLCRCGALPAAV